MHYEQLEHSQHTQAVAYTTYFEFGAHARRSSKIVDRNTLDMSSDDVLGDDGRKLLDACVKVKIVHKLEVKEYDRTSALERIISCYAGSIPQGLYEWSLFDPLTLLDIRIGHNVSKTRRNYTIIEIYNALTNFDEIKYVQKFPKEGPGSAEQRHLIDKRRKEVQLEHKEASNILVGCCTASSEGLLRWKLCRG